MERRTFLKILVATGAAASAGTAIDTVNGIATTQAGETRIPGSGVVGIVKTAAPDRLILRTSNAELSVIPIQGARMYSGAYGEVRSTAQFVTGDRIAASGQREGLTIRATAIGSVFTPIDLQVTAVSRDGSIADTTAGTIELKAGRLPFSHKSAQPSVRNATVTPGLIFQGLVWQHPTTGDRYLMVRD